mmetsp:Transcript_24868/g.61067  ORF Transcript_24868/g.61067 Transcript_24868/m.61067 type:complete len:243 (+) Transcript_24868:1497-2225(+)
MFDNRVKERHHIFTRAIQRLVSPPVPASSVQDREVELILGRIKGGEEVKQITLNLVDAAGLLVNLVDDHDRAQAPLEGLREHELCLSHGAFSSIHQQEHAIDHRHHTLHLPTKIRVTRSVDKVDLDVLPEHARDLGHDRDAPLLLQVQRVHRPLHRHRLAALLHELVHQRRLPVVNVRDHRDVPHGGGHCGHGPGAERPAAEAPSRGGHRGSLARPHSGKGVQGGPARGGAALGREGSPRGG